MFRRKNGRFVKKKFYDRNVNAVNGRINAKKETENEKMNGLVEGKRIVSLAELGKNLKCHSCKEVLSLQNIVREKRLGLHSILTVVCQKCQKSTSVHTDKIENNTSQINTSIVLGAIHSGVGNAALNKILACADIPVMNTEVFKKYENIVGSVIEEEAKKSCARAAEEERELVIKNVQEMCINL